MTPDFKFPSRFAERQQFGGSISALAGSDFMRALCELRRENRKNDPYYPNYHFVNSFGFLNDPNGPCMWNGRWHLFFQQCFDGTVVWGHAASRDLIRWQELPFAIYPDTEGASWSGAVAIGGGKAAALYYGHNGECGLYCSVSSDPLLSDWTPVKRGPVISSIKREGLPFDLIVPYAEHPEVYDPYIWHEDGVWYGLSGGIRRREGGVVRRALHLYRSANLTDWEYLHPFIDGDGYSDPGDDGGCPYFIPFGRNGRYMLMHYSHKFGARYVLGCFDRAALKCIPETGERMNTVSQTGGYMAPAAWPCGDGSGDAYAIYIMHGMRGPEIMSLPHRITMSADGDGIEVAPACDYSPICTKTVSVRDIEVACGAEVVLPGFCGTSAEIDITLAYERGCSPEVRVFCSPDGGEYTSVRLYPGGGSRVRVPEGFDCADTLVLDCSRSGRNAAPVPPEACELRMGRRNEISLRIFVDKSVVEVFSRGGRSLGRRVFPSPSSDGVSVTASGGSCRIIRADMHLLDDVNTPEPCEYL